MKFITEFIEKVRTEAGSFTIENNHFIKDQVEKATYIYCIRGYGDASYYMRTECKPTLAAILSDNTIYIVDTFCFGPSVYNKEINKEILSQTADIVVFSSAVTEKVNDMNDTLLPELYEKLPVKESDNESYCREEAREYIFEGKDANTAAINRMRNRMGLTLSENEFATILCGITTIEELAKTKFEKNKERWTDEKADIEKVCAYMKSQDTVKDWEIAIAEALKSVDAKNVNVTFEKENHIWSGKIEPYRLQRCLQKESVLRYWDFNTTSDRGILDKCKVTCDDITKITYGKKVLFERR